MNAQAKPRPWQEIAIEITKEENLANAIRLARELLRSFEKREEQENTTESPPNGTTA